jgi:xylose isomerase
MYRLLRERAEAFRKDSKVQQALEESKVHELRRQTLSPGDTPDSLKQEFTNGVSKAGQYFDGRGFGFVKLNQLAIEHLLGVGA